MISELGLENLATLVGVGIMAVAFALLIFIILPPMAAFKYYTRKKWKTAFRFALWFLGINIVLGLGMAILNISFGILTTVLKLVATVFIITRGLKKFKVKNELMLIIWIVVANVIMAMILALILGAIWLPIIYYAALGTA